MHRLFISDLHLDDPSAPAFLRFHECLTHESRRVDEIYILGDLVEMWIGDDDDSVAAQQLRQILKTISAQTPVYLMHGNRDFLFGEKFANDTGVTLLGDPHMTDDGLLLSHGDMLCTDDVAYQNMRTLLRSEAWQQDILSKTLAERKAFGQSLRQQSQTNNANKPSNIMDVNDDATSALVAEHQVHILLHGHTHRPGMHQHDGFKRFVTGAWERCGWLARQIDEALWLECFSLAHRYGSETPGRVL
ncbi:MAG: UDP-2,3-diacylglucosamine diphosphatase [Pseudomonadaceae bacterium]|nr:UDP-2,3-diacylglucosamine diphosphatase [Pseudomonadaceae bacterium]